MGEVGQIYCYTNFYCYANFSVALWPNVRGSLLGGGKLRQVAAPAPPPPPLVEESQRKIYIVCFEDARFVPTGKGMQLKL